MISSRPASGLEGLRVAGDLLTRAWSGGSSRSGAMRGDLAWWYAQAWPAELGERLRLWLVDGVAVGWSWLDGGELGFEVLRTDEGADEQETMAVERAILAFAIDQAGQSTEGVETSLAGDDPQLRSVLTGLGFQTMGPAPAGGPRRHVRFSQFQRTVADVDSIPERALPPGYRIRSMAGRHEIDRRVAVHREAFAPSRMSVEKYERLVSLPDYRFDDDLVVEAPDGSFASFAMAWWDPIARLGEFEPVGTDPRHQRHGLSAALLCHGLRRYRELGANLVQVFSDADNVASEALYQSVGFERRRHHEVYRRASG